LEIDERYWCDAEEEVSSEDFQDLYSSPNIRKTKLRAMFGRVM
jgi:hypothetical protein